MTKILTLSVLLVTSIFYTTAHPQTSAQRNRPNIVFIQTDDQGPWALGAAGNREAHTPNLDRLFREGAYLRNAFVATPVCSPSRASLLTSRYGTEVGITDWINPANEPEIGLSSEFVTWPKLLADDGYVNAIIGKWHLGAQDRHLPKHFGFRYFMGVRIGGSTPQDPLFEYEGEVTKRSGFNADLLTDDAISFVQAQAKSTFMLYLNYREPHSPWTPMPEQDQSHYKNLDPTVPNPDYPNLDIERVKRITRDYLANVSNVDRNVGRLLARLDELNLSRNTVVIFTSDHGYNIGHHGLLHKGNAQYIRTDIKQNDPRFWRSNMFDTSLKTPTAIRWPGVIKPGTIVTHTISNIDWFPTILAIANVTLPKTVKIHGRNFLPLLKGQRVKWDEDLYAQFSQHHYTTTHLRAYRTQEWKLVRDFQNQGRDELYNLKADPDENINLINDPRYVKTRKMLDTKLIAKMRSINDSALTRQ